MEEVVGTRLFHRGKGVVGLTDAGVALLPLARRALADLDEIVARIGELDGLQRGHVAIGATPSLSTALLPAVLARFRHRYPGITLEVMERNSDVLAGALERGELDVALANVPIRHHLLEHTVLAVEQLVVVVSSRHVLAKRKELALAELADVPLIIFHEGYDLRSATLEAFAAAGITPTIALDGAEIGSVLAMVREGVGAAIVPSIVAARSTGVHVLRLDAPHLSREIGLVQHRDRSLSRAATALCEEIGAYLAEGDWPGTARRGVRLVDP